MTIGFTVLMALAGDTLTLRESATVAGRWIRMTDLIDAAKSDAEALLRIGEFYLGRAPEEGKTRTIAVGEIRRELERHGLNPSTFSWSGERVEVSSGTAGDVASEIRRRLGSARIVRMDACAPGLRLVELQTIGSGFVARLSDASTIDGEFEIVTPREPGGPVVRKGDVVRAVASGYEVDAKALADGAAGDVISLEFVASRRKLRATVLSAAKVRVSEESR